MDWCEKLLAAAETGALAPADLYELAKPENMLHTVCLQCNTGCGIRVKLMNGVAVKIDGNPYNPWTLVPPIDYKTPLADSAKIEGALCPKGQSGVQTLYDPYRIVKVLKRAGKRGENRWVTFHSIRQSVKSSTAACFSKTSKAKRIGASPA
jgi:anaerobic selenocysteine-containing dehydrogenase